MPRRTSLRVILPALLVVALAFAVGPASAAMRSALVPNAKAPSAQSAPKQSDRQRLEAAVEEAEKRLNAVERELQRAVDLRQSIQERIKQGKEQVKEAADRRAQLQGEVGARARSAYMSGGPSNIASLLTSGDSDQLLKRAELLERIAKHGSTTITDLQQLSEAIEGAQADLVEAEKAAKENEKAIKAKLADEEKAFEAKADAYRQLLAKLSEAEARRRAQQTAASRVSGVTSSGGLCAMTGVPAAAREIIRRESGFNPRADNPTSTAFGLGQLLIGNRQRLIPENPDTIDCGLQYRAFKQYVMERYGSFEAALAFHNSNGWY
jgi:peptidoglycan hydrolase CwlO-like protein